jgi:hypothetical protein
VSDAQLYTGGFISCGPLDWMLGVCIGTVPGVSMTDDRSSVEAAFAEFGRLGKTAFGHNRSLTIGASEIGRCARATAKRKLGHKPDPYYDDNNGFAKRGDLLENGFTAQATKYWVESLGGKLLHAGQSNQITLKAAPLSATPDGLAINMPRDCLSEFGVVDIGESRSLVVEMKSIDTMYKKEKLPKQEHVPQTLQQIGLIRHSKVIKHMPECGVVMYVNASNVYDVVTVPVAWSQHNFDSLVVRGKQLLACKDPDKLAPEGAIAGGRECRTCEFANQCTGFTPWVHTAKKKPSPAVIKKVSTHVLVAKRAMVSLEVASKVAAETEAELYGLLNQAGTSFIQLPDGTTVYTQKVAPQLRMDTKALVAAAKAKGIDTDSFKKETKAGTKLTIQPPRS